MYFFIIIITADIQNLTCLQRQRPFVVFCDVIGIDQIGFVDSCKMMVFLLQELFYFIQFVIKRVTPIGSDHMYFTAFRIKIQNVIKHNSGIFRSVIVSKGFKIESLLILLVLFFKAIAFGGIEEIGWRYSFQPCLEKKIPYIAATIITFLCWSIWHFLFFYIDGSIEIVNVPYFLLGLLTNCFIFSALFAYSNSLWICVMTHALINTLSQITVNDNALIGNIFKVVCICFACFLFHVSKRKRI